LWIENQQENVEGNPGNFVRFWLINKCLGRDAVIYLINLMIYIPLCLQY